jgi:tetratricopeptide (TPR) repeat protein
VILKTESQPSLDVTSLDVLNHPALGGAQPLSSADTRLNEVPEPSGPQGPRKAPTNTQPQVPPRKVRGETPDTTNPTTPAVNPERSKRNVQVADSPSRRAVPVAKAPLETQATPELKPDVTDEIVVSNFVAPKVTGAPTNLRNVPIRDGGERFAVSKLPRWVPPWMHWIEPLWTMPTAQKAVIGVVAFSAVVLIAVVAKVTRPPPDLVPQPTAHREDVERLMKEGKQALAEHRFASAASAFEAIKVVAPDVPKIDEYLALARKSRDEQGMYNQALHALESKNYGDARAALHSIPDDSEYHEQAKGLLGTLDEEEARYLLGQAEDKLKAGDLAAAGDAIPRLVMLKKEFSDHLIEEIQEAKAHSGKGASDVTSAAASRPSDAELQPGFVAFGAGKASEAADTFDKLAKSAKSPATRKRANELSTAARSCADDISNPSHEQAMLELALSNCSQVSPSGELVDGLRDQLVKQYLHQADGALANEDRATAAKAFRQALAVRPGEPRASAGLKKLLEWADGLYMQGYVLEAKEPDEAKRLYKDAMSVLSPQDPDYAKVKKKLDEGPP